MLIFSASSLEVNYQIRQVSIDIAPVDKQKDRVGGLILGLGRFDYPDLANPRDRWRYGMREIDYGEYNRQDMPTP